MKKESDLYRSALLAYEDVAEKFSPLSNESRLQQRERIERAYQLAQSDKKFLRGMREAVRGVRESIRDLPADDMNRFLDLVKKRTGTSFFEISGEIESEVKKIVSRKKALGPCDVRLLFDYMSDYPQGAYVDQASQLLSRYDSNELPT